MGPRPRFTPANVPYHEHQSQWIPTPDDFHAFPHPEAYSNWTALGRPPLGPAHPADHSAWNSGPALYNRLHAGNDTSQFTHQLHRHAMPLAGPSYSGATAYGAGGSEYMQASTRQYHSAPDRGGKPKYPQHRYAAPSPPPSATRDTYNPPYRRMTSPLPTETSQRAYTPPSSRQETPPFTITLPSLEYLALSRPHFPKPVPRDPSNRKPKLLVLDLNGTLIYRPKNAKREGHPRPFLSCFLEYLFSPEPDTPNRPWEVFVWSSAKPHNVRAMVEKGFGPKWSQGIWTQESETKRRRRMETGEGRLLGVWARDRLGLTEVDYDRKVQTTKDLRKITAHMLDPNETWRDKLGYKPNPDTFDEKSIVLLDDSPLKAVHQPWNQVVLPEYDKSEYMASKTAATSDDPTSDPDMDRYLLGVIGILDTLVTVENVPAWIRAGGLNHPYPSHSLWDEDGLWIDAYSTNVDLESLPSHESFEHWHKVPALLEQWIQRGKEALERKGIAIAHGLDLSIPTPRSQSPAPPRAERRYSPSRPNGDDSDHRSTSPVAQTAPAPKSPLASRPRAAVQDTLGQSRSITSIAGASGSRETDDREEDGQAPRLRPADHWRTFRAVDVSRYLSDIADRPSSLSKQDRQILLSAQNLLNSMTPDESADSRDLDEREPRDENMCLECIAQAGEEANEKYKREMSKRARKAGLPVSVAARNKLRNESRPDRVVEAGRDGGVGPGRIGVSNPTRPKEPVTVPTRAQATPPVTSQAGPSNGNPNLTRRKDTVAVPARAQPEAPVNAEAGPSTYQTRSVRRADSGRIRDPDSESPPATPHQARVLFNSGSEVPARPVTHDFDLDDDDMRVLDDKGDEEDSDDEADTSGKRKRQDSDGDYEDDVEDDEDGDGDENDEGDEEVTSEGTRIRRFPSIRPMRIRGDLLSSEAIRQHLLDAEFSTDREQISRVMELKRHEASIQSGGLTAPLASLRSFQLRHRKNLCRKIRLLRKWICAFERRHLPFIPRQESGQRPRPKKNKFKQKRREEIPGRIPQGRGAAAAAAASSSAPTTAQQQSKIARRQAKSERRRQRKQAEREREQQLPPEELAAVKEKQEQAKERKRIAKQERRAKAEQERQAQALEGQRRDSRQGQPPREEVTAEPRAEAIAVDARENVRVLAVRTRSQRAQEALAQVEAEAGTQAKPATPTSPRAKAERGGQSVQRPSVVTVEIDHGRPSGSGAQVKKRDPLVNSGITQEMIAKAVKKAKIEDE